MKTLVLAAGVLGFVFLGLVFLGMLAHHRQPPMTAQEQDHAVCMALLGSPTWSSDHERYERFSRQCRVMR
jgi:hypothetical protein